PIARLLLLGEIDIEQLAHEILQAVTVGIGARQPRGDLGAVDRLRHDAERMEQRSEEHTSELQSHLNLVCRLLLEKKKIKNNNQIEDKNFEKKIKIKITH